MDMQWIWQGKGEFGWKGKNVWLLLYFTQSIQTDMSANSVDPDQTLQYAVPDQGLHCLQLIQEVFRHVSMWWNGFVQILV